MTPDSYSMAVMPAVDPEMKTVASPAERPEARTAFCAWPVRSTASPNPAQIHNPTRT